MTRSWVAWITVALAALTAGCTMCANPYDECGPVFSGGCPQQCSSTARAGSILSAPSTPPPASIAAAAVPKAGDTQILSVTDGKVNASEAAPTPQPTASRGGRPTPMPAADGWKANQPRRAPQP